MESPDDLEQMVAALVSAVATKNAETIQEFSALVFRPIMSQLGIIAQAQTTLARLLRQKRLDENARCLLIGLIDKGQEPTPRLVAKAYELALNMEECAALIEAKAVGAVQAANSFVDSNPDETMDQLMRLFLARDAST